MFSQISFAGLIFLIVILMTSLQFTTGGYMRACDVMCSKEPHFKTHIVSDECCAIFGQPGPAICNLGQIFCQADSTATQLADLYFYLYQLKQKRQYAIYD